MRWYIYDAVRWWIFHLGSPCSLVASLHFDITIVVKEDYPSDITFSKIPLDRTQRDDEYKYDMNTHEELGKHLRMTLESGTYRSLRNINRVPSNSARFSTIQWIKSFHIIRCEFEVEDIKIRFNPFRPHTFRKWYVPKLRFEQGISIWKGETRTLFATTTEGQSELDPDHTTQMLRSRHWKCNTHINYLSRQFYEYWIIQFSSNQRWICLYLNGMFSTICNDRALLTKWVELRGWNIVHENDQGKN